MGNDKQMKKLYKQPKIINFGSITDITKDAKKTTHCDAPGQTTGKNNTILKGTSSRCI